jgi:subtilisin-like proprotein convertase family protein
MAQDQTKKEPISAEGPNPFPKTKKAWSQLPAETQARLQRYVRSSAGIADAGMVRNFRLAMDELYVRDPETGKGTGVMVAPASDLSGLLAQMEKVQAETGLVPELVMYEEGMERNEFTRRVVTRELMLESDSQAAADQEAQSAGLVFRDAPVYAPGKFLYLAESSPEALAAWSQLEEANVVESSLLLARQQAKRAMPNDTLINQQWHLKFNNQNGAVAGTDLNIESVWAYPTTGAGFRGREIRIGIVDDGVQTSHPDFAGNIDTANDYDWNDATPSDPSPGAGDDHGTACAGDAAARGNNSVGVAGSAPEGILVGMRLIAAGTSDQQEADAMNYLPQLIQIKSNSWGPNDTGTLLEAPGPLTLAALKNAAETGRGGKGTIFMWAGGNGLDVNDNSNYDGYANSIYTVAVGAFDSQSRQAWYSESGANLVIVSPSSGTSPALGKTTTDRTGADGYVAGDYESDFGGTSSATPTAAGVVALMLEANANLGWRDVQEILMRSAKKVNPSDTDWKALVAPATINHNHKFGAGLIDATAAVNLARTWTNLPAQISRTNAQTGLSVAIPNQNTTGITREFVITPQNNIRVEHVTVTVSINHTARGNLRVALTSPAGTVSRLAEVRSDSNDNYANWKFMTVRNWGENASGTWRLKITDESAAGNNTTGGTLTSATMEVFGSSAEPINPPPSVAFTSPADGAVFPPGATVNLSATATDLTASGGDGIVQSVEFLANGTVISSNNAAPYTFAWQPAVGSYSVTARATDSEGASANSAPISIQVVNRRPSVTGGQINSSELFSDQPLTLSEVQSTDPDGDSVSYAYQWQSASNANSFTDAAGETGVSLGADPSRSGKKWRCRITPSDAGGAGEPFFTAAVAVNRRPPTSATVGQVFTYDSDLFLAGTETSFTRKAILSEFSQGPSGGSAEWIEFLVLRPGSLRGWKVQDAGGTTVTLAETTAWDNIPAGTLVVIYNGASKDPLLPVDDLSPGTDGKMVVSSADTAMSSGSWPSLSNDGDGVILRDASNAVLSQVGYGSGTTTPNIGAVRGARSANYRGNTEDGGLLAANWSIETATVARNIKALLPGISLSNGTYSQNFNSVPGTSGTAYPDGWTCYNGTTEDMVMTVGVATNSAAANYNYGSRIGLLGSGSAFEPSSLVLAIANTAGASDLKISYNIIKVREQGRSHDFNLEYSLTSPTNGFVAVPGAVYTSGTIAEGTVTSFSAISLPADITNRSAVAYLRWIYKPSASPGSGSRDGLALDDITISSGLVPLGMTLNISPSSFLETAGTNAATGTLTLTQSQTTNLVVNLVSSDISEATVPASVTIPANQTNVAFAVAAVDDLISDGSAGVTITASAGSLSATAAISVTDNEPSLNGVTPGAPNGGDNSVWVGQLRSGALNQPALFRLGSNNPVWLSVDPTNGVLSGTPSSSGNFTITLERTNSLGEIATQTFGLAVQSASATTNFSEWISSYPGLTGTNASLDADPDGDGRSNLMEYYLGLNPTQTGPDSGSMTMSNGISNTFSMTFRRAKGVTGVTAAVEAAGELTSAWGTNGVQETVVDKGTHEEVTATVTNAPGETRMFMRLKVSQP